MCLVGSLVWKFELNFIIWHFRLWTSIPFVTKIRDFDGIFNHSIQKCLHAHLSTPAVKTVLKRLSCCCILLLNLNKKKKKKNTDKHWFSFGPVYPQAIALSIFFLIKEKYHKSVCCLFFFFYIIVQFRDLLKFQ